MKIIKVRNIDLSVYCNIHATPILFKWHFIIWEKKIEVWQTIYQCVLWYNVYMVQMQKKKKKEKK